MDVIEVVIVEIKYLGIMVLIFILIFYVLV